MEQALIYSARKLLLLLSDNGLTLSVAESCTGGLICHGITAVPGASKIFHSGIVAYSDDSKLRLLGINSSIINTYGAVSSEAAADMADAVRLKTGTDFSVGVTGNAGPDPSSGRPVGQVYIAVSSNSHTKVIEKNFTGDRYSNKYQAALESINFLIDMVSENI